MVDKGKECRETFCNRRQAPKYLLPEMKACFKRMFSCENKSEALIIHGKLRILLVNQNLIPCSVS